MNTKTLIGFAAALSPVVRMGSASPVLVSIGRSLRRSHIPFRSDLAAWMIVALGSVWVEYAHADLPSLGWHANEAKFQQIYEEVQHFVDTNNISATTMCVTQNGTMKFNRSFGYIHGGPVPPPYATLYLPQNARMRIASVTKPTTAAVIHKLVANGWLELNDKVFDLGQSGGGILPMTPWQGLGDQRYKNITVQHLLDHKGGWDKSVAGDHTYREVQIRNDMDLNTVPNRWKIGQWVLSQPLQFNPGADSAYANVGYMFLGLVAEEVAKKHTANWELQTLKRNEVFAPLGVSSSDVALGATFAFPPYLLGPLPPQAGLLREPLYDDNTMVTNVFDPDGPKVKRPYGGFRVEARVGQGGMVATAAALCRFLDKYYIAGSNIGKPRPLGAASTWVHDGRLSGSVATAVQRGDGYSYAVIMNKGVSSYLSQIKEIISGALSGP